MVGPELENVRSVDRDVETAYMDSSTQPRRLSAKWPALFKLRSAKSFILLVAIFAWFTASFPHLPCWKTMLTTIRTYFYMAS
jgi:hypothetical protein